MRKMSCSSNILSRMAFSSRAEARSRPNGFSMMTRALPGAAGLGELFHDRAERGGRNGKVIARAGCASPNFPAERLKDRRVVVVAIHVAQQAAQFFKRRRIKPAVFLQAVFGPRLELVQIPARLGHADDRHVERAAFHHRLQRREDLLVSQVAGGPEEHQSVGMRSSFIASCLPVFSRCPPKPKRMAESSLSW